ncbi:Bug family tripartite tricarboxylate transporter substrate binding protein [Bordetella bronchiseptica]|nr:tripartite tricarboxylate transporter substrate binding protein [Bordetella bronchiseptica]KAK64601.1 tripartite tricarboxylate transporter family receptor [Bordetella bronchiseptica 980-2]KCV47788.1 tripartite tricarboxylate transporter family receptor [Bordetella bronchiseptica 3E44]KCV64595.1 tripartite tricarboxylate transporter family receptor [Bordetella bronchiseptica 980]KDB90206.1 tripartite tricarboxylate transporter family receptor [Bordetella bronchiseptica D756]KDB91048.1 tripa
MTLTRTLALAAALALSCPAAAQQASETWPDKPITMIIPSAAGGSADIFTRITMTHLGKALNANIVIENKPGAAGSIGMASIKRARPDGSTFGYGNINTLTVNPALFNKLPYDADADFTPVGAMFSVANVLVVPGNSPYQNLGELIAAAKKAPGKLSYAAAGIGSSGHMGGELLKSMAGIDVLFVPYNGDPASLQDLTGGRIDYTVTNISVAMPLVESGKLKALAITSRERDNAHPDIPTFSESGLPGFENISWGGLILPKGVPEPIVQKISAALKTVMQSDALRRDLGAAGGNAGTVFGDDFRRFIDTEQQKWAKVIVDAGIEKQN